MCEKRPQTDKEYLYNLYTGCIIVIKEKKTQIRYLQREYPYFKIFLRNESNGLLTSFLKLYEVDIKQEKDFHE